MKFDKNIELIEAIKSVHMEIHEVGHAHLDESWNYKDVTYSISQIYFPVSGCAQFSFGDTTIDLLPGNIYLVPAGLTYACECRGSLEKYLIDISVTRPDSTDIFYGIDHCLILPDNGQYTAQIQEIYHRSDLSAAVKLRRIVHEIVDAALAASPVEINIPKYSKLTKKALSYIDGHLSVGLSIAEIAENLFVSKLTLQKHFRDEIGTPIGKYITNRIMHRAERYLLETDKTIRDISARLGFCDQFYFSRVFAQTHGITPSRFRQQFTR